MVEYKEEGSAAFDLRKKVEELEVERNRLEAHTFHLQRKYAELLRELQRLRQPPLMVGHVLEVLPDGRAIIKHTNGNQFVVTVRGGLLEKLRPGMRVALSQQTLAVVDILPDDRDERVGAFEVLEKPGVSYSDIGGLDRQIQELRDVVELPLKDPDLFREIGIEPPKGVLLYGPPGTGKTLLAKAVATESEANFIAIKGPEILSKWVGESERAIREVFQKARQSAPTVIFIDEIDAIAPMRGLFPDSHVTDRIVNQLLTEMDGIAELKDVVVIAATNRPDIIDPSLLRPGRFDRIIYVPPPDKDARLEILRVHTRNVPLDKDVDLEKLAEMTENYSGADLMALVREAVFIALEESGMKPTKVKMKHFLKAMEEVRPSLDSEVVKWYESFAETIKKMKRRARKESPNYIG